MGYVRQRMSERAVEAYDNGEMSFSKWTKTEMLELMQEINPNVNFSKLPLKVIKDEYLECTSWHHTGKHYNRTDFYSIDVDKVKEATQSKVDEILVIYKNFEKVCKEYSKVVDKKDEGYFVLAEVTTFTKSRGRYYPKTTEECFWAYKKWAYSCSGERKSIEGKNFHIKSIMEIGDIKGIGNVDKFKHVMNKVLKNV